MRRFFMGGLLVLGGLGLLATSASVATASTSAGSSRPQNVTCHSGDILTGFYRNVTVPKGNFCELLQATVTGNVTAASGAIQLGIDHSTIVGNVVATGTTDNGWICGSSVGGSVTVSKAAYNPDASTGNSPGQWVIGDASWCANALNQVPGNAIRGSLKFVDNASGGLLSNNDIEHDLICHGNRQPAGTNNQVDGANTGQCSAMGGGIDNDTLSPGDND